jgi:hypothetical protein
VKTLLAGLVALLSLLVASPASAGDSGYDGDTRHCVTHREVWLLGNPDLTRADVERRWEMTGRGTSAIGPFGTMWLYEMCDDPTRLAFLNTEHGRLAVVGIVKE